jgi:osmoprotectant transport system ATP-binding protein
MSALVQLVGVSKTFGDAAAVHTTDLSVERGKTTVLIGPSGCGKSTLLRLIIGLIQPDSGQIIFDGAKVNGDKPGRRRLAGGGIDIVRRRVGYVIQEGGLFPHLTARGNILLMARHLLGTRQTPPRELDGFKPSSFKITDDEMEARLRELSALTRFSESLLGRYPLELSGGQRQRVSLMRALMLSPELLLLDEPLGALDPLVRAALQKDLKEIFARLRQTALLVTHDLAEAAYLGDEIVLVNEGRIVQQGSLADLREKPASPFVSEFINAQRSLAVL